MMEGPQEGELPLQPLTHTLDAAATPAVPDPALADPLPPEPNPAPAPPAAPDASHGATSAPQTIPAVPPAGDERKLHDILQLKATWQRLRRRASCHGAPAPPNN